jgi:hypothetical protein
MLSECIDYPQTSHAIGTCACARIKKEKLSVLFINNKTSHLPFCSLSIIHIEIVPYRITCYVIVFESMHISL